MSLRHFTIAAFAVPFALLVPRAAHAGIESCGNINVRAEAQCKVEVEGGCTAQCTPVKFEAACAGKLEAQCDGQCNATATVDCKTSCSGSCQGSCEANPGSYDCQGSCEGSCSADCSGKCSAAANKGECEASCRATCSGSCSAKCEGTPPSATCEAKCNASCEGSCEGKANIDCQVDCQAKGFVDCKASLEGGCKTKCTEPSGALFCDGQYVDTGNNLQNCIDALNAYLNVKVQGSANAECQGNACTAEAEGSATCSASRERLPTPSSTLVPTIIILAAIGATVARMNRRGGPR